jgi:ribonuclease VapC
MSDQVWDASALLALINEEPGSEGLATGMSAAAISAVNLSEVAAKLAERGMPGEVCRELLTALPLDVHSFDEDAAYEAARLRPSIRGRGLSFGDRACLALASTLGAPAVTTDRAWGGLDLPIAVRLVR